MPVCANSNPDTEQRKACTKSPCRSYEANGPRACRKSLSIGVVNNMGDGALGATERQFISLLDAASSDMQIHLSFYSLPGVPRGEFAAERIRRSYASFDSLLNTHLDGLIITGREPSTPSLQGEPYWDSFTGLLDWAKYNTHSAIWSCLAAHAAVFYMDGIPRVRSDRKHCGLFDCTRMSDHPLTAAAPAHFTVPHSRWNGVPEVQLTEHGYVVLARNADVGIDTFIKPFHSLFVFLQGHPEYASDTLLLEYRRDVGRFFKHETDTYPAVPQAYFNTETVRALTALSQEATNSRSQSVLTEILDILNHTTIENTWGLAGTHLYRNWLRSIAAAKALDVEESTPLVQIHSDTAAQAAYPISDLSRMPLPVQPEHAFDVPRPAI